MAHDLRPTPPINSSLCKGFDADLLRTIGILWTLSAGRVVGGEGVLHGNPDLALIAGGSAPGGKGPTASGRRCQRMSLGGELTDQRGRTSCGGILDAKFREGSSENVVLGVFNSLRQSWLVCHQQPDLPTATGSRGQDKLCSDRRQWRLGPSYCYCFTGRTWMSLTTS